jgi:hypothetical protein
MLLISLASLRICHQQSGRSSRITIKCSNVYVGGEFVAAGGVPANGFASWNGSAWSAVDYFTNGPLAAVVVLGADRLYVAGPSPNSLPGESGTQPYLLRAKLPYHLARTLALTRAGNNRAVVSWPSSTNCMLQQSLDLGSTNWVTPQEPVNDDGSTKSITIDSLNGQRFVF